MMGRMMSNGDLIGQMVKEMRSRLGDTQREFAKRISVTVASVARYESGSHEPKTPVLQCLATLAHKHGFTKIEFVLRNVLDERGQPWQHTELDWVRRLLNALGYRLDRLLSEELGSQELESVSKLAKPYSEMTAIVASMSERMN